ncbi:BA75_03711T0 [Komagataella pastoris]|uniref:BA75_03711T0 n=1 Tax=Komagataella pastoris TaxID=4922 RepID=A0A1B2JH24_PICPA|nr:BA75_03711T0 [Komagataella pastoris]
MLRTWIQRRSIVMVKGTRVQGAVRDPSEFLRLKGREYGVTDGNIGHLKQYLQTTQTGKYSIPDNELLLQILTHKSFAHGLKPYNEKLSVIGFQLLKLQSSVHVISKPSDSPYALNGQNFDCLGSLLTKSIGNHKSLARFAKEKQFDQLVFWKKRDPTLEDPATSGEDTVLGKTVLALIGAINLTHGKKVATEFIETELMPLLVEDVTR